MAVQVTNLEPKIVVNDSTNVVTISTIGLTGPAGSNGVGVPAGGSTGQILSKASGTDYDTVWSTAAPGSGTVTSVALTVPSGLSVSGSPITSSGTLSVTTALSGIIKGDGSGFSAATGGVDYANASHTHTLSQITDAGTAAASNTGDFEASGAVSTHAAVTSGVHGISAFGATLVDDADAATARTTLGLGTAATSATGDFEASGSVSTHAAVTSGVHGISTFGATLIDDADAAAARTTLGLVIDTDVQAYDAELAAIAGLTSASGKAIEFTGSGTATLFDLTTAGKALLDDADAAAQRTTLGVTNIGSYTGQIETAADKTYTIDPGAATARTITGFYIKSDSGTCTATLKVGANTVKAASVSSASGDQTGLANTSVSTNDVITIVVTSNSSALDVIFSVEYSE